MTEYQLFYDPDSVKETPENDGLAGDGVRRVITQISETGAVYEVVDVSGYSQQALVEIYEQRAVPPAVRRGYAVKRIFGTNKYSGAFFGREVPALVVMDDAGRPVDIYPHEEEGRIVTIADYMEGMSAGDGESRADLVKRMDALRARIGKVGVSTSELVKEGRRR